MRILIVSLIPSYWGGSELLWSQTAAALRKRGHPVATFFALFREASALDALQALGVEHHYGTPAPARWWLRWWRKGTFYRPDVRREYLQALENFRPDLVVFSQGAVREGIDEMRTCSDRNLPYVVINQLVEPLFYWDERWQQIDRAYAQARKLWFVSAENTDAVRGFLGRDLPNAEVVPNTYGCPLEPAVPWPASDTPIRLALIARLEPEQKGHDMVIDILSTPQWQNRPLEVSFYGAGPNRQMLARRCQFKGRAKITFAGQVADVRAIWATHHALVMPSRYEGQSLAMLEAMLHGRPVIATPVGGTRGLVCDGETGFLARRCDAEALAEVLERAWEHRADWPRLGTAAAQAARAHVWREPGAEMADRIESLLLDPGQSA